MIPIKKHISIAIYLLTVAGLFLSVSHYHSEVMECLDHASEQHYTEDIPLCPVCSVLGDYDFTETETFKGYLFTQDVISETADLQTVADFTPCKQSRAPPALV